MATPIITVNPPPNVLGIPLGTKISIVFEAEMDVGSILDGNIVITGISDRLFSGPDIALFVDTTSGAYDPPLLTTPTFTVISKTSTNKKASRPPSTSTISNATTT